MVTIYWPNQDLLNDPAKTEEYKDDVKSLIDDLVNDKNLRFEFDENHLDENARCFAVYGDSSLPLISSVDGDQWTPGFKTYLVETYGSKHSTIIDLVENDSDKSVIGYIFQELMYHIVDNHDEYRIENIGTRTYENPYRK